ncbi:MAG: hypothetical protein M1828_007248 [Chrysothrix sp. TS-e1954]|nr:MAG: hypothetical protein M1828_007248 [Chrysothrix sp. TS-e1954]
MGNDGGSIPTRGELVKQSARNPTTSELKATTLERQSHLWSHCNLNLQKPLSHPIVSDALGRLFCKESVIQWLLSVSTARDEESTDEASKRQRTEEAETLGKAGVDGVKDVVELKPQVEGGHWVCSSTGKELGPGGKGKAVYLVPCGHVFSDAAIRNVQSELDPNEGGRRVQCLQCNEEAAPNDVIPILPVDEIEITRLVLRMQTLKDRGLTHALKKIGGGGGGGKKRKKDKEKLEKKDTSGKASEENGVTAGPRPLDKATAPSPLVPASTKGTSTSATARNGINDASTAGITAKVLQEQESRKKRRKMDGNANIDSLFTSSQVVDEKNKGKNKDFMSRGFAIPTHQR